jgi:hypothetical protein
MPCLLFTKDAVTWAASEGNFMNVRIRRARIETGIKKVRALAKREIM